MRVGVELPRLAENSCLNGRCLTRPGGAVQLGPFRGGAVCHCQQELDVDVDQAEDVEVAAGPEVAGEVRLRLGDPEIDPRHDEQAAAGDAHVESQAAAELQGPFEGPPAAGVDLDPEEAAPAEAHHGQLEGDREARDFDGEPPWGRAAPPGCPRFGLFRPIILRHSSVT